MLYLGAHVGMKAPDYVLGSIQEAVSYGANACMLYTGAPQNSKRIETDRLKIEEARKYMEEHNFELSNVIVHAPYIINLANSVTPEKAQFGREFLAEELRRTAAIGAKILVLHPGAHMKAGLETGVEWIARGLNEVLENDTTSVKIALETMSGKGTEVGSRFEELALILEKITVPDRVGICLDTCHIHDAGYDLQDFDTILDEFDRIIGLEKLLVLHINDSKNERGAAKDRHENIGKGCIGLSVLAHIVHHPKLQGKPMILETPTIEKKPPYKEEIELLRNYDFSSETEE